MRVKIQASSPLPEIKAWFSLSKLSKDAPVSLLKDQLCETLQALRDARVHGHDLILLLEGFELLGETAIDVIQDSDTICLQKRVTPPKRKAGPELSPSRKKVRLYPPGEASHPTVGTIGTTSTVRTAVSFTHNGDSPESSSGSDTSSDETSTSEDSSSDSNSESSTTSSDSSTNSDSCSSTPSTITSKKPVKSAPSKPTTPQAALVNVPPGLGKPQTHSRNLRRRKKRQHDREAPPETVSSKASAVNATPLGGKAAEVDGMAGPGRTLEPAIPMMALSNKNKRKGFKRAMAGQNPQRIVFEEDGSVGSHSLTPNHSAPVTDNVSRPASPTKQPRLVPPSEKQEMGLLPPNVFVTSVDVESGLWPSKKGKRKQKRDPDVYSASQDARPHEHWSIISTQRDFTTPEASVELPYDEISAHDDAHDWDGIDKNWESFAKVSDTASPTPGALVGWKQLGIHPLTLTPEMVLSLARVISIGDTEVKVRMLVHPGASAVAFGGLEGQGGGDDVEEETYTRNDILAMEWRRLDA